VLSLLWTWFEISVLVFICRFLVPEVAISTLYRPFQLIISAISITSRSYRLVSEVSGIRNKCRYWAIFQTLIVE